MNKLQKAIYNEGERLIPYVSHDENELIRHRSSYAFFHKVISIDQSKKKKSKTDPVTIVDLGFGTGYGATLLASVPNSKVTGVDIEPDCEIFARKYYNRKNIEYLIADLQKYIPQMPKFDYVVSRGVLEHVPNGIKLIKNIPLNRRIMIDVPYKEMPGNDHHVITDITEKDFQGIDNCEFFYEDLKGNIYDSENFPADANMIMIVISSPTLPKIKDMLEFPIPCVLSRDIEIMSKEDLAGNSAYFETPEQLLDTVAKAIKETEVVADIGCGIAPMNYFRPALHFMIEPWHEYSDILSHRYQDDKSTIVLRTGALEALRTFGNKSVDSIFLLDVIEHMEKDEGVQVIKECERVARQQIILFTPLGFMSQEMEVGEKDAWGLSGTIVQTHKSGWLPEDFSEDWSFYICETFHKADHKNTPLEEPHGAFFAIKNIEFKEMTTPKTMTNIKRPSRAEIEAEALAIKLQTSQGHLATLQVEHNILQNSHAILQNDHTTLLGMYSHLTNIPEIKSIMKLRSYCARIRNSLKK